MNLILWRHAEAQDAVPDLARELTPRGRKQADRMAQWLRAQLPERHLVVVSPAQRTRQTADALGAEYRVDRHLAPDVVSPITWPPPPGPKVPRAARARSSWSGISPPWAAWPVCC
jgi:phosphohistidine phosphatase